MQDGDSPPEPAPPLVSRQVRHPLIVSYYTPGTLYEHNAMALLADINRLGLDARIEPLAARGSWVENCAQKAGFIRDMHRQEKRPLLWLDADARLRRPLHFLETIAADFAIVREKDWAFYSGQVYFGAGPGAVRLLDLWCDYCENFPQIWDQVSLGYAWWELTLENSLKTVWLDRKVFQKTPRRFLERLSQRLSAPSPILQQHFSRQSKAVQGLPARTEFGMDEVPLWWREATQRNAPFALDAAQRSALGLV